MAKRIGAMSVPWLAAVAAALAASPALAQQARFVPSVAVTETYTTNANYGGQCFVYDADESNVSTNRINDQISSLRPMRR